MPQIKPSIIKTSKAPRRAWTGPESRPAVTYGELSSVLEQLGYKILQAVGRHVVFVHAKTKARHPRTTRNGYKRRSSSRITGKAKAS